MTTAAILVIGNEILSGRTRDANLPWLAEQLGARGIQVVEARVVRDDSAVIVDALNRLRARARYVFTTGGIGPTHDDITADAVAAAFGVPLAEHPEARRRLEAHYRPMPLTEARLRMARIPQGGSLIDNPVSAAPGFRIGDVFVLAGVPAIMQAMFAMLAPELEGGAPLSSVTVVALSPESQVAAGLAAVAAQHPGLDIGSYPFLRAGSAGTSLVARGRAADELAAAERALVAMLEAAGIAYELPGAVAAIA